MQMHAFSREQMPVALAGRRPHAPAPTLHRPEGQRQNIAQQQPVSRHQAREMEVISQPTVTPTY